MGYNRLCDRITQLRAHKVDCNLGHSQGYACRILPGLFPKGYVPVLVNE